MIQEKQIELFSTQMRFFSCRDRFTAFIGGIGSGKTYVGCVKALFLAGDPGSLGLIVAPTYPMLRDATLRTFLEVAGDAVEKFNKSEMIVIIRGGGEVLFRSADNPDRLRGPSVHWVYIDEGAMCSPATWDILIGRLRADGKAGPCWVTSTPKGRNWLYQRRNEMTIFRAKTYENPYLSPEFIASLKRSYAGEFARQEIEGEFVSMEGLVYPMFSRDIHVVDYNHDRFGRWVMAMDEGYTNPAVILLIGVDADGRLHIAREFYQTGKLQHDVVRVAADWAAEYRAEVVAVDAAAAGLIADLRDMGLPAVPRKGRVLDGISAVQSYLQIQGDGRPRLTIAPGCLNTINEFESYVWRDGKDEPIKQNDHAMDALRYYVSEVGDWVIAGRGRY